MDIKNQQYTTKVSQKRRRRNHCYLFLKWITMIFVEYGWFVIWIFVFKGTVWPRNHWLKIWTYDRIWCIMHLILFWFFGRQVLSIDQSDKLFLMPHVKSTYWIIAHNTSLVLPPMSPRTQFWKLKLYFSRQICRHKLVSCPTWVN